MIDYTELQATVTAEITRKVQAEVNALNVSDSIAKEINSIIVEKADVLVTNLINRLLKEGKVHSLLDQKLFATLQEKLEKEISAKASGIIARNDLGQQISDQIGLFVETKMKKAALPEKLIPHTSIDFSNFKIPAAAITDGIIEKFKSTGIEDTASKTTVAISDQNVLIKTKLVSNEIESTYGKIETLDVTQALRLSGDLIVANEKFVDQLNSLITDRLASLQIGSRLDIGTSAIYSGNAPVLSADKLGDGVAYSNLRKVGLLEELRISDNLAVGDNLRVAGSRVGINTDEPAGALTVWDEDAEFTVRKYKARTTYLGSTRDVELVLGVNGNAVLAIKKTGIATKSIDLDGIKLSTGNGIPNRDGIPGEIVIQSPAMLDLPWAYQCVEGKIWTALKR